MRAEDTYQTIEIGNLRLAYKLIGPGNSPILVIIETAIGSCMAEWWHVAERIGVKYQVLVYDRAGYGESSVSKLERTPLNIAFELEELLRKLALDTKERIFIGHSQGGLYVQQHVRRNPERSMAMILLDPLTTEDEQFRRRLTPEEYRNSGVEKTQVYKVGRTLCRLKLGFIFKPLLRKSPPFYYQHFTPEAEGYISISLTRAKQYQTAILEYRLSHQEANIAHLRENHSFPEIPIVLITHSSTISVDESMRYTGSSRETAEKVEDIWQEIMKTYLSFSKSARWINASKSGHYIHLTEPELIEESLEAITKQHDAAID